MPHLRRLPLASVYNMRDLGGYAAAGGTTAFGRLWRADLLGALPDMDISAILAAGVRTVIDLRGPDECLRVPSSFLDVPGVRYVNVSLLGDTDQLSSRMGMPLHDSFLHSLSILYSTMLDCNGHRFVQVFEAIFEGLARGGVAFHCTAGKDRTGVIAAMALELCGVARADIVADYAVTEIHLRPKIAALPEDSPLRPKSVLRSTPETIEHFLDHLQETYGGTAACLSSFGFAQDRLAQLVSLLLE